MFIINDTVLYGSSGVCKIADITEMELCGAKNEYYILKPVYCTGSTVFVPVANAELVAKMRRIMSKEEIMTLIGEAGDDGDDWIENENARKVRYKEVLDSGDSRDVMRLIRMLYRHRDDKVLEGKRLHVSDERFMRDAEKLICDEFSIVLGIKPHEVPDFIASKLAEAEGAKL